MSDIKRYEITWSELVCAPKVTIDIDFAKFAPDEAIQILERAGVIENKILVVVDDIEKLASILMRTLAWSLFCNLIEKARTTEEANNFLRRARLMRENGKPGKFENIGVRFISIKDWDIGQQRSVTIEEVH
ncbi:hypothetical protein IMT69_002127 [Salmonella enterica]|nr:hypothetical protein [Salmonella enterica]EGL7282688.1 hypothetical protein [Salmonella enterica]EGM5504397.1 hypothetical protein [Salmonella enterica]EGM5523174.1 hypothetical protein [Salmonella enterica]EHK6450008.1 hypothetical protein [Salmonella enterica]